MSGDSNERREYDEDDECVLCGFPDLDGLWYDGTCDECHDIVVEQSIHKALIKNKEEV